jgi:hypothetical protein
MPVDDRKILSAIRMPGERDPDNPKRYTKGAVITDPDELVKSGADLQALHDAGKISGTWKGVKAAKEEAAKDAAKKEK